MTENINITLPADSKFVMPIRLFSSGIGQRVGMDIEDIEDFKQAIAEACMLVMAGLHTTSELLVTYILDEKVMVEVSVDGEFTDDFTEQEQDAHEISKLLLEALCADLNFTKELTKRTFSLVFDVL